jgi:cyclopropane fatty-acyl-phospholipid synthase-like methyltransferase
MSIKSFENYAKLASMQDLSDTEISGRYGFQQENEGKIINDVLVKLKINSKDTLLEIGCGPGNLLVPLSDFAEHVCGIDNEIVIQRLNNKTISKKIQLIGGDFLVIPKPIEKYSKILIYSVVHYLDSEKTIHQFLQKAFELVQPGGMLLLGDLPNVNKKKRYLNSSEGKKTSDEWSRTLSTNPCHPLTKLDKDTHVVTISDEIVLGLLQFARNLDIDAYVLPQPADLPFGNTREDILFIFPN